MSMFQRQVVMGMCMAIILFVLITTGYFIAFPLAYWQEVWDRQLMDIPFIVFVPSVSIGAGLLFGVMNGFFWRKQLHFVDKLLHQVEEGHLINEKGPAKYEELESIESRIIKIQKQMSEQVKLSQRLATEKVVDQETRIQEIISQERNRLARELHDSVSQQLFAASMMMSAINEMRPDSDGNDLETKQLKMVEEMIHQSQLEMRALLLHLRPAALKGKTLQEGIEDLLSELEQKVTMKIQSKIEDFPLDKGVEDHLFRILQESLSNTLRHAKATMVEVLLIQRDELIIFRVVDDGVGFDVEEAKAGSYGLQNIYERAVEIGGTIKIVSVKQKGTRLEVKIPRMTLKGENND